MNPSADSSAGTNCVFLSANTILYVAAVVRSLAVLCLAGLKARLWHKSLTGINLHLLSRLMLRQPGHTAPSQRSSHLQYDGQLATTAMLGHGQQ